MKMTGLENLRTWADREAESSGLEGKIDDLDISVRAVNCLTYEGIVSIVDLIQKTEKDLLLIPNFGQKSLAEIKAVLAEVGPFHLGMTEYQAEKQMPRIAAWYMAKEAERQKWRARWETELAMREAKVNG